ncbi:hypothetical protein [Synechocystis sp. CACIAM 05]|uniref:hypothetical protein n=1 Tax=Synechocystis sp. CACIAM 05 TaxID=1933929 RepID=UPI00138E7B38|nr:hypothetical protein [Synechocystis sp. CACIAM 05]QHU99768.1 hypothetical protein BWK47_06210 [Synechocystis sp. CACIAM 05]
MFSLLSSNIVNSLLLLVSIAGIGWLQTLYLTEQNKENNLGYFQEVAQEEQALKVSQKMPNLGFNNILADWLYLKFIQYFGDNPAREQTNYALVSDYFQQIVDRDPRFNEAIFRLETANTLFAGNPDQSIEQLAKALDSQAVKFNSSFPTYYLWRMKGNNELLFRGDVENAKHSYAKSAISAQNYGGEDGQRMVDINQNSINVLKNNPDSKLARISAWVNVLSNSPDQKTTERVIKEIEALGGQVTLTPTGEVQIKVSDDSI